MLTVFPLKLLFSAFSIISRICHHSFNFHVKWIVTAGKQCTVQDKSASTAKLQVGRKCAAC